MDLTVIPSYFTEENSIHQSLESICSEQIWLKGLISVTFTNYHYMLLIITSLKVFLNPGKYALIGAAANLGGVLRMTISLTVILMETTGIETSFFFPLIITLISAKWVGDYFNEGIYDIQVKVNHVPMLPWEPLPHYLGLKASNIMSSPVVCIKLRDKSKYIYDILNRYKHNGFPVVEDVEGVRIVYTNVLQ